MVTSGCLYVLECVKVHHLSPPQLLGPACVKTWITDVILRDKFSLFYNSRLSYFEFTVFVGTDSGLPPEN